MCDREIEKESKFFHVLYCFIILVAHKSGSPSRGFSNQIEVPRMST